VPWSRFLRFSDPFICQKAIQAADVEILPTAKGNFRAEISQIGMDRIWMQRFEANLPLISTVAVNPRRKVIGFLTDPNTRLQHCGTQVSPGDLLVAGLDVLHQRFGPGLHYGTMSLPVDEFLFACRTIVGREFLEESCTLLVRPAPALMSQLLRVHRAVARLAHEAPDLFELPELRRALEGQLINFMVRCLAESVGIRVRGGRRHSTIVARFEEFLEAHPDQPLYLTDICAAIGVPERTLRASCEEHLGMGPIRFLTLRRMHLVRRALQAADASMTSVTRIATDHGFWELGRFSVAYRALFGEPPSETLRRPVEQLQTCLNRPSSLPANIAASMH
jgi:AraC-like DNA-binding protein